MEALDDEEPYSDDDMLISVPEYINKPIPVRKEIFDYLAANDSSDEADENDSPNTKTNRRGMKEKRKARIVSAGKARKIRAGRV